MMLSIMSLIRETLSGSSQNDASTTETHGATALKRQPGDFDAMLSRTPPENATCNSMSRIKTKTSNAQNDAESDDDDSPDSTRCMSPDDFMAWAFNAKSATQTIPSPDLEVASSKTMKMNAVNANELPSKSSIIAAGMHDISDEPISENEIRPQASILEPAPATERVSIGKLARSQNATEVPPPSVLPMIDADDVMPTTARYDATPQQRQEATNSTFAAQMAAQMTPMSQRADIHELPTRPELRAHSAASRAERKSDGPEVWVSTVTAEPPMPRPMLAQNPAHDTIAMARVEIPAHDGRDASNDARQEAAANAVNQLTLKKAAGGELDIPELGKVKVGAEMNGAEVDVRIQADRQETRVLVASHAHEIAADARSAAIPVNGVRVDGASAGRAQMNFTSSGDSPRHDRDSQRDDDQAKKQAFWMPYAKRARFVL